MNRQRLLTQAPGLRGNAVGSTHPVVISRVVTSWPAICPASRSVALFATRFDMHLFSVALMMALLPIAAAAQNAWSCVAAGNDSSGDRTLKNLCQNKLHVELCLPHNGHPWACPAGGLLIVDDKVVRIPATRNYFGPIFYAACVYPKTPKGWDKRSSVGYRCE